MRSVPAVIEAALQQAGLEKEQVDWLVMHQANQRIPDAAANRLGLPAERVSGWAGVCETPAQLRAWLMEGHTRACRGWVQSTLLADTCLMTEQAGGVGLSSPHPCLSR